MNITKKNNIIELSVFIIFCIFTTIASIFHEPWFDEVQAWAISKDSISNILFLLPHYEGHPPLWHLILKCFSFFNVPVEYGIKIPNLLFTFAAVWLLIFKSPFPKTVKLTLPFTYFIFYQYSIISRPYSIFCFALFLAATLYKTRNEKPFRFMGVLALLCLSSAYGMIFTAGICIAWFIDVVKEVSIKKTFIDKRFYSMFILFILCCILAIEILPAKDVFAFSSTIGKDYILKFLSAFFILPADATITNFFDYITIEIFDVDFKHFLQHFNSPDINAFIIKFWSCCLIGAIANILLFIYFKIANKVTDFLIPYSMFLFLTFILYMQVHHIGLLFIFLIYAFWCVLSVETVKLNPASKRIFSYILFAVFAVQLYWGICANYTDLRYPYSLQREVVNFIKEQHLTDYKMLGTWSTYYALLDKKTNKRHISHIADSNRIKYFEDEEFLKYYNKKAFSLLNHQHLSVVLSSYFNKKIFYNFNMDNPERLYLFHIAMSEEKTNEELKRIRELGLPDVIFGNASLDLIFNDFGVLAKNYRVMETFRCSGIWKDKMIDNETSIYMRNDLFYEWIKGYVKEQQNI